MPPPCNTTVYGEISELVTLKEKYYFLDPPNSSNAIYLLVQFWGKIFPHNSLYIAWMLIKGQGKQHTCEKLLVLIPVAHLSVVRFSLN